MTRGCDLFCRRKVDCGGQAHAKACFGLSGESQTPVEE